MKRKRNQRTKSPESGGETDWVSWGSHSRKGRRKLQIMLKIHGVLWEREPSFYGVWMRWRGSV